MLLADIAVWLSAYRASAEFRSVGGLRDKAAAHHLQETLLFAKQVIVSYAGLLLTMDMFPQVSPCCCITSWGCFTGADSLGHFSVRAFPLPWHQLKHEDKASVRLERTGVPGCLLNLL